MELSLLILGAVGGLLPDVIRIMKDPNSVKEYASLKLISVVLQVALGVFAVWLLYSDTEIQGVSPKVIAVTLGFAAPEILTRTLSAIATLIGGAPQSSDVAKTKSFDFNQPKKKKSLLDWWGE